MSLTTKPSFFSYLPDELTTFIQDQGLPTYLASQCLDWVYNKHVLDPYAMRNIAKKNQEQLHKLLDFTIFKHVDSVLSKEENALKNMCCLKDNNTVECVVLKEKTYYTLCISSQCGCPVDCKFCLTGVIGFKRQLTVDEIVKQVVLAFSIGKPITNIVFMGMGEPLLNYEPVQKAIAILTHPKTYNISNRGITVSTAGYIKGIERLMADKRFLNIAFSVGAADPLTRERFMPIENRNPITQFVRVLAAYQAMHNRKLTLEYTLLLGVNDSDFHIQSLVNLSLYLRAKINLINLNPHSKIPFQPVSIDTLHRIRDSIKKKGAVVTIRYKKGQDITAACGQLGQSYLTS